MENSALIVFIRRLKTKAIESRSRIKKLPTSSTMRYELLIFNATKKPKLARDLRVVVPPNSHY